MPEIRKLPVQTIPGSWTEGWSAVVRLDPGTAQHVATVWANGFSYANEDGNFCGKGIAGFFVDDVRVVAAAELRVNGELPELIDTVIVDDASAVFCLRLTVPGVRPGDDGGIVVLRQRHQSHELRDRIRIENHTGRETQVVVEVEVDSDLVPMTDLLLGHESGGTLASEPVEHGLCFARRQGNRWWACEATQSDAEVVGCTLRTTLLMKAGEVRSLDLCFRPSSSEQAGQLPARSIESADAGPTLHASADAIGHLWAQARSDLRRLRIWEDGLPVIAAGMPRYMTLFGRDSILTAIEVLMIDREAALGTAQLLARLQGSGVDPARAEEPGRILHELRRAGRGASETGFTCYYESIDATPLFCILVRELLAWGAPMNRLRELLPAVHRATGWVERRLAQDGWLVYEPGAGRLPNQGWKDTADTIVDRHGHSIAPPIAVVEAQAYAVAALRGAADLELALGGGKREHQLHEAGRLNAHADELASRIEDRFWLPSEGRFAMALGRDGEIADAASSNQGHLLWARAVSEQRAAMVARSLLSEELWSGWGVRTLSTANPRYEPISYHRGGVWPHDTMLALSGLLAYGHDTEAITLAEGLLAAGAHFEFQMPELFAGFSRAQLRAPIRYPAGSAPQAWAAAVPIYLVQQLLGLRPELHEGRVSLSPRLPEGIELELRDLQLSHGSLSVRVRGRTVLDLNAPSGIAVEVH